MNENNEVLEHMYQDSEMATYSLETLLNELKGKDNKIIKVIEDILKNYENYYKDFKKQLKKEKVNPKSSGMMAKMGSSFGIKKEVIVDNSDSRIADMLIKGLTMGTLDMEKKISKYSENIDKKTLKQAEAFLKFSMRISITSCWRRMRP